MNCKTAPLGTFGVAQSRPPWASMIDRLIASPMPMPSGLVGAVVKDPVQDRVVWQEYLETVVKERDGWKDLYRACRDQGS